MIKHTSTTETYSLVEAVVDPLGRPEIEWCAFDVYEIARRDGVSVHCHHSGAVNM